MEPIAKSGASIAGKLDTLAQLMSEINADTSRTAETVIPQLGGDQAAIDAANDQAVSGAPDMGGMPDAGADMPPEDTPMPDMPPEGGDAGMPPADVPEEVPVDDMGMDMPPEGTADVSPSPEMESPEMAPLPDIGGAPAPDMGAGMDAGIGAPAEGEIGGAPAMNATPSGGFDINQFIYTPKDALDDFITAISDEAHTALDEGDSQKVVAITAFVDGVKKLWEQYMGGMSAPLGEDASQGMDVPAPDMGADAGEAPVEIPEGEPAPEASAGIPEGDSEEKSESGEKSDEKKDDDKDNDKKDDDKDGMKKSEEGDDVADDGVEASCSEKSDDEKKEDVADEPMDKCDGVKKSVSLEDRFKIMAEVMEDNIDYMNAGPIPLCKSQVVEYEKTADIDMASIIDEFRNGGIAKSSRPPAESAMGDFRADSKEASRQVDEVNAAFDDLRKAFEAPSKNMDEVESQMEALTSGLRARRPI